MQHPDEHDDREPRPHDRLGLTPLEYRLPYRARVEDGELPPGLGLAPGAVVTARTSDGQHLPMMRRPDGSYVLAEPLPGLAVTVVGFDVQPRDGGPVEVQTLNVVPAPDVVTDPAVRDDERREAAHPAAAGAGPDDPRTAPSEEDEAYARRLLLHGSAAVDLGRWPEDVEPVPPIVHRFRLHVFRSPAPTRLQQQVAGSEDGVLAAAIAQLPACPDEALRFNLLLDAMRDGLAPFARGRHAVQALVSGETAERWTTPMIRALLPAELVDGPTTEPNPRGRSLAVATRLPLGDTRASQGLWSSKGCHWGAGMANVVVTDADGTPPGHRRGDDTDNAGDLA